MIYTNGMITLIALGGIYGANTFNFTPEELLNPWVGLALTLQKLSGPF